MTWSAPSWPAFPEERVRPQSRESPGLPVVAVVGRPNVGKSSLVNRLLGRREAIVEETAGVTRDRTSWVAEWGGRAFEVVDTGGLEAGSKGLEERVAEQAHVAIATADLIVLVVDVQTGPTEDDAAVAALLRRAGKPVLMVVNKVDDDLAAYASATFYKLGLGDPLLVSALHGRGSGDLLEALVGRLPPAPAAPPDQTWASLAIVGRPNVGKSSILNTLVGDTRAIVHELPGTTRDPVDSYIGLDDGRLLRIVDTAGIRRQVQIQDPLEYFGWLRSRRVLARVDAALMVVDAAGGVTSHDQRIARAIVEAGRACVIVLNKWDLVGGAEGPEPAAVEASVKERLRWLRWAPVLRTSATTGRGIDRIVDAVKDAVGWHRSRIQTAALNRIVGHAQAFKSHPRAGPRAPRVLYAVQTRVGPPRIALFSTGRLEDAYIRYIEGRIRADEPFTGTPLALEVVIRSRR
jgi:GTP-binding protein